MKTQTFLRVLALACALTLPVFADQGVPQDASPNPSSVDAEAIEELLEQIQRGTSSEEIEARDLNSGGVLGLSAGDEPVAAALTTYLETGEAPVLGLPTHRAVPFGHETPVIRCLPLRACDLAFQRGEILTGWALGDTERWLTDQLQEGEASTGRAHLLIKPTDYELATNLIVVTNRRTYHMELEAPAYDVVHSKDDIDAGVTAYDAQLSWWYPDEFVQRVRSAQDLSHANSLERAEQHREAVALDQPLDPSRLSFAYEISQPRRRSRRLPWEPTTVMDDGRQVYLRLPESASRYELPVLLGRLPDGSHYPLNTRIEGRWIIVPALFDQAELILGTGPRRRRMTITTTHEVER